MLPFKWLTGNLVNILLFVIYLLILKPFGVTIPKFSGIIILGFIILISVLALILFFYIKRILGYDTKRLEQIDILSISRTINLIPILTAILFLLFILSVSAYDFRISKNISTSVLIFLYVLPGTFISYYSSKSVVYEVRLKGFYTVRKRFPSITFTFVLISIIYLIALLGIYILNERFRLFLKYQYLPYIFVLISYLISIFIFVFDISRTAKYILRVLKVPEVFEGNVPIIANNEFGLISVYVDKLLAQYSLNIPEFPIVNIGDKKVRVNLGKNFYGIGWIKLYELKKLSDELSEVLIDKLQKCFTVLENIISSSGGYIFFFNGIEAGILWGLDGRDLYESINAFLKELKNIYKSESFETITVAKVGITVGTVFIGQVEGTNGVVPYFFGEGILESQVLSKYPKNEGIFFSGKLKNFLTGQYIGEVKLKETEETIEIYKYQ